MNLMNWFKSSEDDDKEKEKEVEGELLPLFTRLTDLIVAVCVRSQIDERKLV